MTALLLGITTVALVTALYVAWDRITVARAHRRADRDFKAAVSVAPTVYLPQGEPSLPPAPQWSDSWISPSERKGL